jgi:two-component system KDP operon response regulator KdpE
MRASGPSTRILAVTGEVEFGRLVRTILESDRKVTSLPPISTISAARPEPIDIVLLDLQSADPEAILRAKRAFPNAQIITMCGEYRESDCIAVLDMDADYLGRPFWKNDLLARVRAAELRLFNGAGRSRYYRNGSLIIDLFDRHVLSEGRSIDLSPSETKVLMLLTSRPGRPVAYDRILAAISASVSASGRQALRNLVLRLRRRIERDPRCPELVLTEPGFGYRLAEPRAEQARQSAHYCSGYGIVG